MTSYPRRSLLKGLSWESISLLLTFALAWLIFGQAAICGLLAIISFTIKIILFYIHERAWHKIKYGKANEPTLRRR